LGGGGLINGSSGFKAIAPGKAVITADDLSGDSGQAFTLTVSVTP
jgi:hypothetical protein